jgi:uncharacterized protein YbcI
MEKSQVSMAEQIAEVVADYEQKVTGHSPKSVTVVFGEDTLVVTMRGALTPAEMTLAQNPEGSARMQEFHRRLFDASSEPLRREIKRITGLDVRNAAAEVEPASGGFVKTFVTGVVVHVFLLDGNLPAQSWSDNCPKDRG